MDKGVAVVCHEDSWNACYPYKRCSRCDLVASISCLLAVPNACAHEALVPGRFMELVLIHQGLAQGQPCWFLDSGSSLVQTNPGVDLKLWLYKAPLDRQTGSQSTWVAILGNYGCYCHLVALHSNTCMETSAVSYLRQQSL